MKLSDCALLQMLLRSSDICTDGQVGDNLLTNPSAFEKTSLGIRKAPLKVRDDAVIRGLSTQIVRVLQIELLVGAT